jgi:hypothetical protein
VLVLIINFFRGDTNLWTLASVTVRGEEQKLKAWEKVLYVLEDWSSGTVYQQTQQHDSPNNEPKPLQILKRDSYVYR